MPDSAGLNSDDGAPLVDWEHVRQSIATIFSTPKGSRVMLRDFGSEVPKLIDRPMTPRNILAVYAAAANAIAEYEPRFRLTHCSVKSVSETGRIGLVIAGDYMPRGHLGDFTIAGRTEPQFVPVVFRA